MLFRSIHPRVYTHGFLRRRATLSSVEISGARFALTKSRTTTQTGIMKISIVSPEVPEVKVTARAVAALLVDVNQK